MPIIAVASTIGSFGAAAGAAGSLMSGLAMVGKVVGLVGLVTGNKKLAMFGGALSIGTSLMGGLSTIGGAAAGEQAGGDGGGLMGDGGESTGGFDSDFQTAANQQVTTPEMSSFADTDMTGGLDPRFGSLPSQTPGQVSMPSAMPTPAATSMSDVAAQPFSATAMDAMSTGQLSADSAFNAMGGDAGGMMDGGGATGLINSGQQSGGGFLDNMGRWVKDNQELTRLGLGVLQGAFPTAQTKASTNLTKAQEEAIRQRTEEERRRALWRQGRTE